MLGSHCDDGATMRTPPQPTASSSPFLLVHPSSPPGGPACVQEVIQEALHHSQRAQLLEYLRQDPAAFARLVRDPAAIESLRRILSPAGSGLSASGPRAPSHVFIEELPAEVPSVTEPHAAAVTSMAGSNSGFASIPVTVSMPLDARGFTPEPPHQRLGKRKLGFEADQAGFEASYHSKRSKHDPLSTEPTLPNVDAMED